ncbi:hypothetical protein A2U01_0063062, partial [Trifolium medium]|nr:hypothetical protein [Trifolium medium]
KPIVISSLLTLLEEEELLKEVETVNDGLGGDLNGVIPIYCLHTPKKDEDLNPVVQSQELSGKFGSCGFKEGRLQETSKTVN